MRRLKDFGMNASGPNSTVNDSTPNDAILNNSILNDVTAANATVTNLMLNNAAIDKANQANNEAHNAAILEAALDCIIMMNHEGRVLEWNAVAERTFGYTRSEAVGQEMASLIIPERYRPLHRAGLAHYLATGEGPVIGQRIEISAVRADGSEFPVELGISRVAYDGPPLFTGFIRDLTASKAIEQTLRLSEERFRTLVQAFTQIVWTTNSQGEFVDAQPSWSAYTGQTWEELKGWGARGDGTSRRTRPCSVRLENRACHSDDLRVGTSPASA